MVSFSKLRCNQKKFNKLVNFFPVALVACLLLWSGYVYWRFLLIPHFKKSVGQAIVWVIFYMAILFMVSWCYFVCVSADPGSPKDILEGRRPRRYLLLHDQYKDTPEYPMQSTTYASNEGFNVVVPDTLGSPHSSNSNHNSESDNAGGDDDDDDSDEDSDLGPGFENEPDTFRCYTVTSRERPRFCRKCNIPKPDRTHHCSVCGKCILKMDHHCPWLNNCVGHKTHKAFFLFLTWASIYCILICASTIPTIITLFENDIYEEFSFQLLIACLIGGIFGITLVLFSCYHAYLISTNTTTLEGMQAFTYRYGQYPNIQFSSSSESVNIFNVGISKNWRQVLGPLWYLWLVPIDQPTTDGAHFPINENVYRKLFFE